MDFILVEETKCISALKCKILICKLGVGTAAWDQARPGIRDPGSEVQTFALDLVRSLASPFLSILSYKDLRHFCQAQVPKNISLSQELKKEKKA